MGKETEGKCIIGFWEWTPLAMGGVSYQHDRYENVRCGLWIAEDH